jgi:glycosyltransferase involved in cell wall biosynthesis
MTFSKPLSILVAAFTFPPNKDGVAEASSSMVQAFLDKGWNVEVATGPTSLPRNSLIFMGSKICEFAVTGTPYFKDPFRGEITKYRNFLLQGDWDVIVFQAYWWPLSLALPILNQIKSKKILVSHGHSGIHISLTPVFPFGLFYYFSTIYQSIKMLGWLNRFSSIVFLSHRCDTKNFFDHILAKLCRHPHIDIIPNGINTPPLDLPPTFCFRNKHNIPADSIFFLCVANYEIRKDQGFAVRAFRKAAIQNSCLVFIGSKFNPFSRSLQSDDAEHSLLKSFGKIIWLENVPREETLSAFSTCDCFVLSSEREAQPIVLLEAMSFSRPWIARDSGCISEMPGGIVVQSTTTMAEAMQRIASDSKQRAKLGKLGFFAIQDVYNKDKTTSAWIKLVEALSSG